jgi:ribosomal protein S18 acetylase RimI-like enzyme
MLVLVYLLNVVEALDAALKLYEHCGFKQVGLRNTYPLMLVRL